MSEPFLAEVRIVGFNFAPRGWAFCDGQLLPINQYQSLFSLLGTVYGGDGRTTFALPEMRGRTPMHVGDGFAQGQKGGEENHFLTGAETPNHTHNFLASSTAGDSNVIGGKRFAAVGAALYTRPSSLTSLNNAGATAVIQSVGGNQSHNNMAPWIAVNFCIALQGLFPSRN